MCGTAALFPYTSIIHDISWKKQVFIRNKRKMMIVLRPESDENAKENEHDQNGKICENRTTKTNI